MSAVDVALGHKNLLEAERGFRDLNSDLLIVRVAERGTGQTWRNINRQLGRITRVTLAGPAGAVTPTTPIKPEQKAIYQALHLDLPARVTAFDPA